MESDVQPKFVRGLGAGSKRTRMIASTASQEALPSSASIFCELTGLPMDGATSSRSEAEGMRMSKTLPETNIGFKLLKKSGWKEGSGLGISEQGRLNPLEPQFKSDRRGIGAKKNPKQNTRGTAGHEPHIEDDGKTAKKATKKEKNLSKKAREMKADEERMQEQSFEQQFYREFWPENV
ncbi:unnamed protein product [Calypogeia fissa]